MRIALTGGIACGKSAFARMLNELGVETLDADDIVHELIPADERRRLAKTVFADPAARKALEARIHPLVRARLDAWLAYADETRGARDSRVRQPAEWRAREGTSTTDRAARVAVIPLLFETGWDRDFDLICCLTSARETQIARMMETRGHTREEAEARLAAQMPVAEKASRSHVVVTNDGTLEDLRRQAVAFVSHLRDGNPGGESHHPVADGHEPAAG